MAPFLINHPVLLNNWNEARETALARVRSLSVAQPETKSRFLSYFDRARSGIAEWVTDDNRQRTRLKALKDDLRQLADFLCTSVLDEAYPWDKIYRLAEKSLSLEAQELVVSLLLEPHGALVDDLCDTMSADEEAYFTIRGAQRLAELQESIEALYGWALAIDYAAPQARARFWYVSQEKLEPRLGERFLEAGAEREQRLAIGHDVAALYANARGAEPDRSVADFLVLNPEHRHAVRRVQMLEALPYSDVRDNIISAEMVPVDLLRCKLSFFGATKFDPRSDRWVRITMYQYAPLPDEISRVNADDWAYPPLAQTEP
jgi:hypothetical protein